MNNPKIPAENKAFAQQRHQQLWTTCKHNIRAWAAEAVASPNFSLLLPAMVQLAPAVDQSVRMGADSGPDSPSSSNSTTGTSGKLMEEAAVRVSRVRSNVLFSPGLDCNQWPDHNPNAPSGCGVQRW